jgi:6-pyruvoyl-tetrahydropterin synthase
MDDTPEFIKQKQHEIIMAKSAAERLDMAFEMAEFGRLMVRDRVRRQFPDLSEAEIQAKFIREYYYDRFSEEEFQRIDAHMLKYYQPEQSTQSH